MPSIYNNVKRTNVIDIPYGSIYSDTITVTGVNLTGYGIISQLRNLDGELVATFTITNTNLSAGIFTRSLTSVQTSSLTPSLKPAYVWGIQLTKPNGEILREIQGGAVVSAEVVYE